MPSPIGIIDISTPKVKKPIPRISSTAPKINKIRAPGVKGAIVILRIKTITVIGRTEETDSRTFSFSRWCNLK